MDDIERNAKPAPRPASLAWRLYAAGIVCAAMGMAATAFAADESPQARYSQDRADCMAGRTNESQATCLREAGAAFNEAKAGRLHGADAERLRRNAMERCQPLSGDERQACLARMRGEGSAEGSVAQGAIIREYRTITPGQPQGAADPASVSH